MEQEIKTDQVEQLWYTWSTTGLDEQALAAGFRVRAASSGLTDLYGERMNQLNRYLRYSLPPGADPLRTRPFNPQSIRIQEDAPICLTFALIESGERVLIHKVYTGKDGRGRPGAYFAHLLAPLPTDFFSARDAIRLWRHFSFWHTSDVSGQVQGTILSNISLARWAYIPRETTVYGQLPARSSQIRSAISAPASEDYTLTIPKIPFENTRALSEQFIGVPLEQATTNTNDIDEDLRFVIRAYLLRRKAIEDQKVEREEVERKIAEDKERIGKLGRFSSEMKQLKLMIEEKEGLLYVMGHQEPPRIYIAAPPDRVAYLIAGLTRLLPRQFLEDMTFSTYEDDILTKLPLDIVGTCKPPISLDHSTLEDDILPPICYQKGFVLNTYLREKSTSLSQFISHTAELDPHEAIEHARIVIDTEEYARFVVDELREVMLDNGPAAYQQYTILTPIKEVDDMFRELGDTPEKGLKELPALSVSDLLTEYTTSKQMPLREIASLLQDPSTAMQRLKKRMFRKQLFDRIYQDPLQDASLRDSKETQETHLIWLQHTLPALLANLRGRSDSNLNRQLDILAKEAAVETHKATLPLQNDLTRFLILFIPLESLESVPLRPPEPMTKIWSDLLSLCYNNSGSQNFINQHWEAREKLLEIAIEVLEPDDPISQFLLNVETIHFGKLLLSLQKRDPVYFGRQTTLLPGTLSPHDKATAWLHQTVLCFLQKGTPSYSSSAISKSLLYDANTIQQLEQDFFTIKNTFVRLLTCPEWKQAHDPYAQWHNTAQFLLLALVNSGYEHQSRYHDLYKMELLEIWFADTNKRKELPTFLSDSVPLSVTELEWLLTTYGEAVQQRASSNKTLACLFWRLAALMSPQKMAIVFQLLDRYVSEDKFNGLLNPRAFETYTSTAEFSHLLKSSSIRLTKKPQLLNVEEAHMFLKHYSKDYRSELEPLYNQPVPSYPQKADEGRHQYIFHYPNAIIWQYILSTFQTEKYSGRMPLVYTLIRAAFQSPEQLLTKDELDHYLKSARLSDDEYVTVVQRFGPDLLAIPALASLVPQYYNRPRRTDEFVLLLRLLDATRDKEIANQLLALTKLDHAKAVRYFEHYSKIYPPFCYRLPVVYQYYKQLSWKEIQPFIPAWLKSDMSDNEIEMILGQDTIPLQALDHSLTEKYAQHYLTKYPQSNVFLTLCQYYLETFDIKIFESQQGIALLDFLFEREKQQIPSRFDKLIGLITTWYTILQFLKHPTSEQDQLLNIFRIVYQEINMYQRPGWIAFIARALVTCFDYPAQLGSAISSLCIIDSSEVTSYLDTMVRCIQNERSNASYADERWLQRTSLFLEFLFLPDLLNPLSIEIRTSLISLLLANISDAQRDFIEKRAAFWSPATKKMAMRYIRPYNKPMPSAIPASVPPSTLLETQPTDTTTNPVAVPETPFFVGIRKSFYAWLIFPWLFLRLWSLQRKSGVDKLAYFWLNNKEALEKSSSLTPPTWKRHLQFACRFQTLCWESANSSTPVEADKELLDVINTNMYQSYLAKLTASERWRILLAVKRTVSPLPEFLTLSAPSDKQEEQKTGSDEQEPVVNQQPPAQKATTKGTKKGKFSKNKGSK